jgi:glycerol kinase
MVFTWCLLLQDLVPHTWNQHARGTIVGLTRGTSKAHLARAALESIAFQTMDVLKSMEADSSSTIRELRVDGGATINNLLMQIQADVLGVKVVRPEITETTAMGAAYFAGLATGFWKNIDEIKEQWSLDKEFIPALKIMIQLRNGKEGSGNSKILG